MNLILHIKKILRRFGVDLVKYRSFWDLLAKKQIRTVIDIGANEGVFAETMRARFPNAEILSFEPLKDCFLKLEARMQGDQHFKGFNIALGAEAKDASINRSSFHPSSSLLPMSTLHKVLYPKSATHTEEHIRIERLDDVLKNTLERPVFVKIDVQGFEAQVLRGAPNVLSQTDILLVETSFTTLYEGQPLFGDIHDLLRASGFEYRGRAEVHYDERTGEPIYEDSVFVRKSA